MDETNGNLRKPWIAAVLSLLASGLGHIYCGRIVRGVVLFVLPLLAAPVVAALMTLPPSGIVLALVVAAILAVPAVYLFAVVDSVRIARRIGPEFTPREYNRPLVYALLVAVGLLYPAGSLAFLRGEVVQAFMIPTPSMAPAVACGDRVLVNKFDGRVARGDVIVFRSPEKRDQFWIKRVVGLPGDRVEAMDGEEAVPAGAIYVLGDNRECSRDSRQFGCVPMGDVLGRARYRFWPLGRFGVVK